jgi:hypothetical protein
VREATKKRKTLTMTVKLEFGLKGGSEVGGDDASEKIFDTRRIGRRYIEHTRHSSPFTPKFLTFTILAFLEDSS